MTFLEMKENVGDDVQDDTPAMLTRVGRYLNRRYMEVMRAINWDIINDGYTISATSGTADYDLPADFKTEVYCVVGNNEIQRTDLQRLAQDQAPVLESQGNIQRYAVWEDESGQKKVRFHYTPATDVTVYFPYIVRPVKMSNDSDEPLLAGIEDLLECGARADALKYKRKWGAANQEEMKFQQTLTMFIWEQENQKNQVHQFKPKTYNRDLLY
jgi:hypothetical protein